MARQKTSVEARREGLRDEQRVKNYLASRGYDVRDSDSWVDMHLDIDGYLVHPNNAKQFIPISIKTNNPEYFSAPFIFELEQGFLDGKVVAGEPRFVSASYQKRTINDNNYWVKVVPSWYYKGQARFYFVWKRDTEDSGVLWLIDKPSLRDEVRRNGFDTETETNAPTATKEIREGKAYTKLGLMSQEKLRTLGIAKKVGYIG